MYYLWLLGVMNYVYTFLRILWIVSCVITYLSGSQAAKSGYFTIYNIF